MGVWWSQTQTYAEKETDVREIAVFAVDGGPCAGKTTVLSGLQQELQEHGVTVAVVPEAARELLAAGISPQGVGNEVFQELILERILFAEDLYFRGLAQTKGTHRVLLCDRGAMSGMAYAGEGAFRALLARIKQAVPRLRDSRYDGVIHLRTAADGAPQFYRTDAERRETLEEAIALDRKIEAAWTGHPSMLIVDNSTDLYGKQRRALAYILKKLGLPEPLEIERKYRVAVDIDSLPEGARKIDIEQVYLSAGPDIEERVRKRGEDGVFQYFRTQKRFIRPGVREEREWKISRDEYLVAKRERDPARSIIRKHRWCFVYENQYFELDRFITGGARTKDLQLLEIELTDLQEAVVLPPFIEVFEEVTDNQHYSNFELAA